MFSKKKKVDAKPEPAGAPAAASENAAPPAENPPSAPAAADDTSQEGQPSGGLLASGLGAKGSKVPSISASRLGGRPPSRPSAPAPAPAPAPVEAPAAFAAPAAPAVPFGGHAVQPNPAVSGQQMPAHAGEGDAGASGRMNTMQGTVQGGLALQDAGADGSAKKNPYKLNPLYDVILPVSMFVVFCVGFAFSTKVVKDKHGVYPLTDAERQTIVRDPYLASPKLMDDVKKLEPLVMMESGDAGALAAAKAMGSKALSLADQQGMGAPQKNGQAAAAPTKEELDGEEQAVRELLASGMVMAKLGNPKEKELGLTYMAKAEDIATYSKYVRLLYARELVRVGKRDDEAIKQYQDITNLFKDPWPLPHKELAMLLMRANRGTEAVQELTVLIKADPTDPSYQRQLGLAMAQNGDQQAGFEDFQKGFTREQDVLGYPAAVKALVEAHGGLVDATLADVKKQADSHPNDIKLQLDLARLEIATLKYKEARDIMEKARKAQELNPEVHEVMAEVMCRQNQQSSGYDEFRAAAQNLHLQQ
jgi:Flp pilus assembly protein TadD